MSEKTRLYNIHRNIYQRCTNPNNPSYQQWYGSRGISLCAEWRTFKPFEEWALANGYSEDKQIDRIDNDGNYEPSNCRWVTLKEQGRNRRTNVWVEINGETEVMKDWIDDPRCSVDTTTVYRRLARGWSPEDALFVPSKTQAAIDAYNERKVPDETDA